MIAAMVGLIINAGIFLATETGIFQVDDKSNSCKKLGGSGA